MAQTNASKKSVGGTILSLFLAAVFLSVPITASLTSPSPSNDFNLHIHFASLMVNQQVQSVPAFTLAHPAYQLILDGIYLLLFRQADMKTIALAVQILVQFVTLLVIYHWLGRENRTRPWLRAALAVLLSLAAPVMAFVFWDGLYYLGYIGAANYHNPTIHLLKPVALLMLFYCILPVFDSTQEAKTGQIVLSAVLTIFSALIKPNYLLCILPAIGIMAVIRLTSKKTIHWRLLILGLLLPGALILLAQFLVTYNPASDEGGIIFSPLSVMRGYSGYLLPKLLLSMLFPLSVLALNFRKAVRDPALALAWLGFLAGVAQTYLLAEGGERIRDGNFGWGAEIMLFVLFVASASFLWREAASRDWRKPGNMVVLAASAAHVAAGMAYWVYALHVDRPW